MGGDALPLQKRLSVDGPGVMPGFGFRDIRSGRTDIATCTSGISLFAAAECERVALAQLEFRGALPLLFGAFDDFSGIPGSRESGPRWVVFTDVGRGWLIGAPGDGLHYSSGALPSLSSFRSDVGLGIDFHILGLYAAKAVSEAGQPMRLILRVDRRF
jgi:hypothetical protein